MSEDSDPIEENQSQTNDPSLYEQPDRQSPDVPELHREVIRDEFEPHEGNERVPVWMFLVFIGLAMWSGWYVSEYDGGFRSDVFDGPDAFRVVDYSQPGAKKKPLDPEVLGKRVFNTCITCHQADGEGLAGKYPPLNQSEWVQGDDRILARILLNGLNGPIEVRGQTYNNQMPAWKQLSDYDIAAVLTHIRQSWNNDLPSVAPSTVAAVRAEIAEETTPYNPADLAKLELPNVDAVGEEEIFLEYKNAGDVATMAEVDEGLWVKNLKETYVIAKLTEEVGDPVMGEPIFTTATCITCHVSTETQKAIAPSLDGVSKRMKREEIIDSILHPSAKIAEGYEAMKLALWDDTFKTGSILEENDDIIRLRLTTGEVIELPTDDVLDRVKDTISPMPIGLVDTLTVDQLGDLVAYLESLEAPEGSEDSSGEPVNETGAAETNPEEPGNTEENNEQPDQGGGE
ncbi:MAG: c-type cytochrome [Planctomycetota bacterium]